MKRTGSPDINDMLKAEKARNAFYSTEYTVTEVRLDLNKANKACDKACGNRAFKASEFVRFEKNAMVFKREMDAAETVIRNNWIRNLSDVKAFVRANFSAEEPEEPKAETKRMHYSEYKNNYSNCKTVKGSYDPMTKTIEVIIG